MAFQPESTYSSFAIAPVWISEAALEELSGWVAGKVVDEVDRARDLVAGKMFAAERNELVDERKIRLDTDDGLNDCLDFFTVLVVGYSEYRHVCHRRVHHDDVLDLLRVDVDPAGDDH